MNLQPKIKTTFLKHVSKNLGLINLFGKSFGRLLYLALVAYFSYKLSIKHFAEFAIFWSSLRMFAFYGTNNINIIYFNKVRHELIENKKWPLEISTNVVLTITFFSLLTTFVSFFIFQNTTTSLIMIGCLPFFIIIRIIVEFSKADNNLFLSIFIDDFLFYVLFFLLSIIGLLYFNDIKTILYALLASSFFTALTGVFLFAKKFNINIKHYKIKLSLFSFKDFKLGISYTILRGNEVLSNFAVRYLGQIYFGDLFVAYAHIMYQFYNIFSLLTMAVVSGFQSKITAKASKEFNKFFIKKSYMRIVKTIFPFIFLLLIVLVLFGNQILLLLFPKFVMYHDLLIKVAFAGLLFAVLQPLIFILVYNNRFINITKLNTFQYIVMILLFGTPLIFANFNDQLWFLLIMISIVIIQGFFASLNYFKTK